MIETTFLHVIISTMNLLFTFKKWLQLILGANVVNWPFSQHCSSAVQRVDFKIWSVTKIISPPFYMKPPSSSEDTKSTILQGFTVNLNHIWIMDHLQYIFNKYTSGVIPTCRCVDAIVWYEALNTAKHTNLEVTVTRFWGGCNKHTIEAEVHRLGSLSLKILNSVNAGSVLDVFTGFHKPRKSERIVQRVSQLQAQRQQRGLKDSCNAGEDWMCNVSLRACPILLFMSVSIMSRWIKSPYGVDCMHEETTDLHCVHRQAPLRQRLLLSAV